MNRFAAATVTEICRHGSRRTSAETGVVARFRPPPCVCEAEAAEAEEAQREHRPGRWFGDGRRARRSEYGRATRHEEVERRGADDFVQTHAAAGPLVGARREQAAPSSESASKPPMRLPKLRMSKLSSVMSLKPPVKSIARPPSSVVSLSTQSPVK